MLFGLKGEPLFDDELVRGKEVDMVVRIGVGGKEGAAYPANEQAEALPITTPAASSSDTPQAVPESEENLLEQAVRSAFQLDVKRDSKTRDEWRILFQEPRPFSVSYLRVIVIVIIRAWE